MGVENSIRKAVFHFGFEYLKQSIILNGNVSESNQKLGLNKAMLQWIYLCRYIDLIWELLRFIRIDEKFENVLSNYYFFNFDKYFALIRNLGSIREYAMHAKEVLDRMKADDIFDDKTYDSIYNQLIANIAFIHLKSYDVFVHSQMHYSSVITAMPSRKDHISLWILSLQLSAISGNDLISHLIDSNHCMEVHFYTAATVTTTLCIDSVFSSIGFSLNELEHFVADHQLVLVHEMQMSHFQSVGEYFITRRDSQSGLSYLSHAYHTAIKVLESRGNAFRVIGPMMSFAETLLTLEKMHESSVISKQIEAVIVDKLLLVGYEQQYSREHYWLIRLYVLQSKLKSLIDEKLSSLNKAKQICDAIAMTDFRDNAIRQICTSVTYLIETAMNRMDFPKKKLMRKKHKK